MLTNMGTLSYIQALKDNKKQFPEVDIILMAIFFDLELHIYFLDDSKLYKQSFNLSSKLPDERKVIRLYLGVDGKFDLIYKKSTIESAGICQSILLDVILYHKLSYSTSVFHATNQNYISLSIKILNTIYGNRRWNE